jgi:hypothetical protein
MDKQTASSVLAEFRDQLQAEIQTAEKTIAHYADGDDFDLRIAMRKSEWLKGLRDSLNLLNAIEEKHQHQ